MRLWHYKLIPYLPNSQLKAQWRELNLIFKKQPKHILINYIYKYDREYLLRYSMLVIEEMRKRDFHLNYKNYNNFFEGHWTEKDYQYPEHNFDYLQQCFYNLQEKYQRGQEDFDEKIYNNLSLYFWHKESLYKVGKYETSNS